MRISAMVVGAAAFFMLAGSVLVSDASADDRATCDQGYGRDYVQGKGNKKIAACTRIIEDRRITPKTRAIAYKNRGDAYLWHPRNDFDRAIAEYSEAIRLDPEEAAKSYYFNRATAYGAKGDYDRAIADYSEIIRVNPAFASSGNSLALAYDNRGWAYDNKGDYDRAIADFSDAIRLEPKLAADAFSRRGRTFSRKKDFKRALADYNEAVRIDPKVGDYIIGRGNAYFNLKDYDHADADYNDALRLTGYESDARDGLRAVRFAKGDYESIIAEYSDIIRDRPRHILAHLSRGIFQLYVGNSAKALADVSQAAELDPKDAYSALWLDIVGQRNNVQSRLSQSISRFDMTAWPAPIVRMFLGQLTPAAVLAAAEDKYLNIKKDHICEANFFSGELALRQGAKVEATRLFRLAASDCPHNFLQWYAANAELKALGVTP